MSKIAIIGAGNMGTAIAKVLAENNKYVKIWNWSGDLKPLRDIDKYNENKKYLKGVKLPKNLKTEDNLEKILLWADIIFVALPSSVVKQNLQVLSSIFLNNNKVFVDLSKGLENNEMEIIPKIIRDLLPEKLKNNVVGVSGPAIARQIANQKLTFMNIAGYSQLIVKKVQNVLQNSYLRLIPIDDLIGLELAGSFKNVYAILIGVLDALEYDLNTKSAVLVSALNEMSDLIVKIGGKKETIYSLAGLGDLIGTSLCQISRNRSFGFYLGQGYNLNQAKDKVGQVVEGIEAVKILLKLGKQKKQNLPVAKLVNDILEEKINLSIDFQKKLLKLF